MNRILQLAAVFVLAGALAIPISTPSEAFAELGFTNVKKSSGIIMKFCANETFLLQDCHERYEGIGWTDRINVLIYAPGWNEDEANIEKIGDASNPITVYTNVARVDNVEFSETGPDTGVFMGVVKMTGQRGYVVHDTYLTRVTVPGMTMDGDGLDLSTHDRAVMIASDTQDGRITVAWEFNEDEVMQRSASYTWQIGQVEFHKDAYDFNEEVTFFIRDTDLWKHHGEFFTNYVRVYSDSDIAGINVGVQFVKAMEHAKIQNELTSVHLTSPAASSLTKYTPDREWKTYLWWEPGGVIGVDQDYDLNLMVHDGLTDIHETGLSYDVDIYLNGELVESRTDRYAVDGQGVEPIRFDQRGSAKIVISNIFDQGQGVNFSFQVAPEAILEQVVSRHSAFDRGNVPSYFEGYEHPHYINYLPGRFYMTSDDSSDDQDQLRVSNGDTIYVEYEDLTLPRPYATSDTLEITARAYVVDTGVTQTPNDPELFVGTTSTITPVSADIDIPSWVKNSAAWWSNGEISDPAFAEGIEYLVKQNIINVSSETADAEELAHITSIPSWVKNNAAWWSEGQLSDADFANGLEYLIKENLIDVPENLSAPETSESTIPDWLRSNAAWWSEGLLPDSDFLKGIEWMITNGIIDI